MRRELFRSALSVHRMELRAIREHNGGALNHNVDYDTVLNYSLTTTAAVLSQSLQGSKM